MIFVDEVFFVKIMLPMAFLVNIMIQVHGGFVVKTKKRGEVM